MEAYDAHHDFSVPQYVLVASRVQYNTTGVGVDTMDMQNAQPPFLLGPLQHLLHTHTYTRTLLTVGYTQSCSGWARSKTTEQQ